MSELMWKVANEERRHAFIRQQDARFQSAMRAELRRRIEDRGTRIVPAKRTKPKRPADILTIAPTVFPVVPQTAGQTIIAEVIAKHGLTKAELIGEQQGRKIAAARREAAYRMKTETTMSLPQIARRIGWRDHSTVIAALKRYEELEAARADA